MQRAERCDIAAIASRDETRARKAAERLGIARAYGSYEALLADPEIEAIYNPLPNELHVPWTVKALEAGKHVLCEKPIALDAGEARTLIAARDKAGKLVAEAFMVRYHPQWRRARELAQSGAIGPVGAIQTFFSYRLLDPDNVRNRPPGGGGLYDIGCYAILTARYVFGAEPTRVVATLDRDPKFGTDRLASAILEFPGGRHLTFTAATQLSPHQRVTIVGEAGRIEILIPFNALPDRPMRIVVDYGADLVGGGARVEDFPGLRPVRPAGRRLLPRRARRGAARIPDRGRGPEHAGDRRPVPLRRARELGDAVAAKLLLPRMDDMNAGLSGREPLNGMAEPGRDLLIIDVFDVTKSMGSKHGCNASRLETADPTLTDFLDLFGPLCDVFPDIFRERLGRPQVIEHNLRVRD